MNKLVKRIELELDEIVADIFEAMTNVTCVPVADSAACWRDVAMSVEFHGQMRGSCVLWMSASDAMAYALVMLGEGAEMRHEWAGDAVSELCNMIAGGWKSLQPPPPGHATMSSPSPHVAIVESDAREMRVHRCYAFGTHGFSVEVVLHAADAVTLHAAVQA